MSFPAHILLPVTGAVLLALALLGSWLWPEPTAPSSSAGPPALATPAALAPPAPPLPAPRPPPPRPVARAEPPRPVQATEPPRNSVAMPAREAPPPPQPLPPPQVTQAPPPERRLSPNALLRLRERPRELVLKAVEILERQRDRARERGDEAEWQRLDALVRTQRERLANMQATQAELPLPPKAELPTE